MNSAFESVCEQAVSPDRRELRRGFAPDEAGKIAGDYYNARFRAAVG
jgi:hypothetical protein